jgi:UDP-N-acetylglucosamine 2-epimerase (hydrolysing)
VHVHVIGSPDLDLMNPSNLPSLKKVKEYYEIIFDEYAIVMFHPVTTDYKNIKESVKTFVDSLLKSNENYVVIYPNNDLGTEEILEEYKRLENNSRFKVYPSLRFEYFLRLLKEADFIIGNSSAGVREAPYYKTPTIDIGSRQHNRGQAESIDNVGFILEDISEFGEGNSNELFLHLLLSDTIWQVDCQKQFQDL